MTDLRDAVHADCGHTYEEHGWDGCHGDRIMNGVRNAWRECLCKVGLPELLGVRTHTLTPDEIPSFNHVAPEIQVDVNTHLSYCGGWGDDWEFDPDLCTCGANRRWTHTSGEWRRTLQAAIEEIEHKEAYIDQLHRRLEERWSGPLAADENVELLRRLGKLLDEKDPGWRDSPSGRWLNAVERPDRKEHGEHDHVYARGIGLPGNACVICGKLNLEDHEHKMVCVSRTEKASIWQCPCGYLTEEDPQYGLCTECGSDLADRKCTPGLCQLEDSHL